MTAQHPQYPHYPAYAPAASYPQHDASPPRHPLRQLLAVLLVILGTVAAVLTPVAIWARDEALDTDTFIATVAPAAHDPGVQNIVIGTVDDRLVTALQSAGVPAAAAGSLGSVVHTAVSGYVRGPSFPPLWNQVTEQAHRQVADILTGRNSDDSAVQVDEQGVVTLQLAPIVNQVKRNLVARGLTAAANVQVPTASIELARLQAFSQLRAVTRNTESAATWLPWITALILVLALLVAPRRRRTLIAIGLSITVGTAVAAAAVQLSRSASIDRIPTRIMPRSTASYLYDLLVRTLFEYQLIVIVIGVALALGALLAGPLQPSHRHRLLIMQGEAATPVSTRTRVVTSSGVVTRPSHACALLGPSRADGRSGGGPEHGQRLSRRPRPQRSHAGRR